ncbi:hypothetical protein D3C80_1262700 [compost metagenome]
MLKFIDKFLDKFVDNDVEPYREDFETSTKESTPKASMSRLENGKYADPAVEAEWVDFYELEKIRSRAW